ncbi:hypothetical protein [Paractinoplanes atraurantiacus]|uniref:Lipoprotein n=1 Tax=Paractinoplanes atraurantiacus TaxID=1036182 RepID=A0A285JIZ6_9ACTN|nr:hypothetical protein [Actinoplanes atraurantiacus]SNY59356.1 hypothetical protein SAMN05421748_120119 [Actinoplanes atraurantiacus]
MTLQRKVGPAAIVLTAMSLSVAACGNGTAEPAAPAPAVSAEPAPAPSAGKESPAPGEETRTPTPSVPGSRRVIADGRWPAYVTAVGDGTLTMDLVEFLTGDRAIREWQKRYPDSEDRTPPNDYLIVNDNPRKRTLPIISGLSVKVLDGGSAAVVEVGVAGLKERLGHTLFWLTVKKGKVVLVRQQFLP